MATFDWLTDEQLENLLDRYYARAHQDDEWAGHLRELVRQAQNQVFNSSAIDELSDGELVERLVDIYKHIVSVPMFYKNIFRNPDRAREALRYLLESEDDVTTKINALRQRDGVHYIKGLGKAFWSLFTMALDPQRNAYWNNKTEKALKELGMARWSASDSPGERYRCVCEAQQALADLHPEADLYAIDHFMHFVTELEGHKMLEGWRKGPDGPKTGGKPNPEFSIDECADETHFDRHMLARWVRAIERKKQSIIYGPPGTGKTYLAEHLSRHMIGGGDGFSEVVQFHPAYAYEDFIQGLRPDLDADGGLRFHRTPGRFLDFCREAEACDGRCVLIIDEINRANLSRVFGELMYLLEYRDREVPLAAGGTFRIPENVRIIGTMNTADRSIALVDHALRRRFAFLALYPGEKLYNVLCQYHRSQQTGFDVESLIRVLKRLNRQIDNRHYAVGITFFLLPKLSQHIADIWQMEIEPYLEEYFFDQPDKVEAFRWSKVSEDNLP